MALAVAANTETTPADSATHTVTKPSGTASGDRIVVIGHLDSDASDASALTPPSGQGFSEIYSGGASGNSTAAGFYKVWEKTAGGSEPTSWTFGSSAGSNSQFQCLRITGASGYTWSVYQTNITTSASGTNHVAPSVNVPAIGDLILAVIQFLPANTSTTVTVPSGMTSRSTLTSINSWLRSAVASLVATSAGASGTKTFTSSVSSSRGDSNFTMVLTASVGATATPATLAGAASFGNVTVTPKPKLDTLTDNFSTSDSTKWNNLGTNPVVTSGALQFTPDAGYPSSTSARTYDLTSSSEYCEVAQMPNVGNGTTQAFILQAGVDGNNFVRWAYANGGLFADCNIAGVITNPYSGTYDATTHRWLRIRESAGTVYWDYSANGYNWVNAGSAAVSWDKTQVQVYNAAGFYGTEPSPGLLRLDNFNVAPVNPAAVPGTLNGTATFPSPAVTTFNPIQATTLAGLATFGTPTKLSSATALPANLAATATFGTPTKTSVATASPGTLAGTATFPTSTSSTGSTATPANLAATATFPTPTKLSSTTASPASLLSAASFGTPTLSRTATATPSTLPATANFAAPSVTAGGGATSHPATLPGTATFSAVSPAAGSTAAPGTLAGVAAFPAPTTVAGADATATPGTVSAGVTFPSPTVSGQGNASASPATLSTAATFPPPSVSTSSESTATPQTLSTAATFPTPTTTGSSASTASPATLQATASFPAPGVRVGSTITVSTLNASATFPAPTAGTTTIAAPQTVFSISNFGVPSVFAQRSQTAQPLTLAALSVFPQPSVSTGNEDFPRAKFVFPDLMPTAKLVSGRLP